ncbi:bifunctional polynucleotide phosphatase/kinase-like isoform X2 [Ornithodoros turicata]|uniref:bifunctional polynucleotide phosphatase/kinase-like isoform X2 n=1 Tax=Ornithodoros turicata TaxID=34597 RepID=UPI0031390F84
MFTTCTLVSDDASRPNIKLAYGEELIIGRCRETRIRDRRCSKRQVKVLADFSNGTVTITQLGPNSAKVLSKLLHCGESAIIKDGDKFSLLPDGISYTVKYERPAQDAMDAHNPLRKPLPTTINKGVLSSEKDGVSTKRKSESTDYEPPCKKSAKDVSNSCDTRTEHVTEASCQFSSMRADGESGSSVRPPSKTSGVVSEFGWTRIPEHHVLLFRSEGLQHSSKIAAFDLDGTIITTKSGKVFPVDVKDWKLLYSEVRTKLKSLAEEGYKIVVITNQRGVAKGYSNEAAFMGKLEKILEHLNINAQVYVCFGLGFFRKPVPGVWRHLETEGNGNIPIDMQESFYVGDAAGRQANWEPRRKKDFSSSDRLFALNVGLRFHTPEEFFLKKSPAKFELPSFDPRNLPNLPLAEVVSSQKTVEMKVLTESEQLLKDHKEVVILVGFPASGKTHFAKHNFVSKKYVHINRDILGSWQKCVSECEKALSSGHSVVIDNTSPDVESRKRFTTVAKKFNCECRCLILNCTLEQAKHNNKPY